MTFEETLVCDGCAEIIDGGSREQTLRTLRDTGGRAFGRYRRGELVEAADESSWPATTVHLCGRCAGRAEPVLVDGEPVPAATSRKDAP